MPEVHASPLTAEDFDRCVLAAPIPVLVYFWGLDCPPCDRMKPVVGQLAADVAGRALVFKVAIHEERALAERFHVMSFPQFLFFRGGEEVQRLFGMPRPDALREALLSGLD